MSLITPQLRQQRAPLTIRFDVRLLTLVKRYAEFINSTADYVISEALIVTLLKDDDFRTWLRARYLEDVKRLDEMSDRRARPQQVVRRRRRVRVPGEQVRLAD